MEKNPEGTFKTEYKNSEVRGGKLNEFYTKSG